MVMMMMIMVMMNCFCGMVNWWKAFSLIYSWDDCQIFSSSQFSSTQWAGFESVQNLSSGFIEGSCAVVITTRLLCSLFFHFSSSYCHLRRGKYWTVSLDRAACFWTIILCNMYVFVMPRFISVKYSFERSFLTPNNCWQYFNYCLVCLHERRIQYLYQ